MDSTLYDRLHGLLDEAPEASGADAANVLTEGLGHALSLDAERLRLERRITSLAVNAEDPDAARELRQSWLRHRTLVAELRELRGLLRELGLRTQS